MTKIIRRQCTVDGSELPNDINPVLKRVYAGRGVHSSRELERSFQHLHSYDLFRGIDAAVGLLWEALQGQRHILVVADFDADGATSCATAVRALRMVGAGKVSFLVPNRFEYGYGLTPEIVEVAASYQPDLLITVDNGISSVAGVASARERGIKVLVTDHHLPGDVLPAAEAIVNPNQSADAFPGKHLAGVGVIFYVMLALRAKLREEGWFRQRSLEEPNLAQLLDLVALGTVADVVPLDHCNRILVAQGLLRIQRGRCCRGIAALLNVAGRNTNQVVASDLGFAIGPRLNAAGRLEDMTLGIECLLTDDLDEADTLAQRLDRLNRERREIEHQMKNQALAHIETFAEDKDERTAPIGVCLFHEEWHQGVVGIVASRIKERLHRPVIAFARTSESELKGSARSVAGLHIRDVLDAVASKYPGLLTKFGGHAMAAGLSLPSDRLAPFKKAFDEEVRLHLSEDDLRGVVYSDGELTAEQLNLELAEILREAGPWGQGFPEPVFDGVFDVLSRRIVGEKHLKLSLKVPHASKVLDAIAFNTTDEQWPADLKRVEVAYKLDVNEYRGQRNPQLVVEYIAPA